MTRAARAIGRAALWRRIAPAAIDGFLRGAPAWTSALPTHELDRGWRNEPFVYPPKEWAERLGMAEGVSIDRNPRGAEPSAP